MPRNVLLNICTVVLLFITGPAAAQLTITVNTNPTQLAQKILGKGVTILNAQFKGGQYSAGTFKAVPGSFLIDSGVVLTTGVAKSGVVPGFAGVDAPASAQASYPSGSGSDADLTFQGDGAATNDACVLEFDFIPQGDSIYVRYIFGSEEYPEFVCSPFNDIFAFLITGPGILGKKNIALVPVTTAVVNVKINTVNSGVPGAGYNNADCQIPPGSGSPFPQFYVNNVNSQHVVFDGYTVILTAKAKVTPCQTYHIRLGVADVSDQGWDSGVFIEANSFMSKKEINTTTQGPYTDPQNNNATTMIEACKNAQITLTRAQDVTGAFSLTTSYAGTATPNVDFTTDLPAVVSFAANENVKTYNFAALADPINEGLEKIVVRFAKGTCITTFVDSAILYIRDSLIYRTKKDTAVCPSAPITISGHDPEPSVVNSYMWTTGDATQSITVNQAGTYIVTHTYSQRCQNIDTFKVISNGPQLSLNSNNVQICPGDTATLTVTTTASNIVWNTGATTNSIKVTAAGKYWVSGSNANCANTDTVTVTMKPAPTVNLGADTGMCQSNTIMLDATYPGASYQWSNGATTPTINVSTAGQYSVINTLNGCTAKDTINITVNPRPVVNLGNDTSVCADKTLQLDATFTGATYQWSNGATTPTINVTATGEYSVINSLNGCIAKDTINVTFKPVPTVNLGADTGMCQNNNIMLDATYPGASYQWNNGATTATISVTTNGQYSVINTLNGCTAKDTINITVNPIPVVNLGSDTSVCADKTLQLNAAYPGATHTWSNGATTPTINVTAAGEYSVTNSLNGCIAKDTINIAFKPVPVVELGADRSVCEQDTIHLDATYPGASYQWNNGATTAMIVASTAGKYVVVNTLNGCTATDSMTLTVKPIPVVNLGGDTAFCENKSIMLNATYPGASYSWSNGATTSTITVNTAGQYRVLNSLNGCFARDTINITTKPIPALELGPDRSVCDKDTIHLNAFFPGATYSWSNGASSASIVAGTTGKYKVTSTANGCSNEDSMTLTVKPIPVVNLGGDTAICENITLVLNANYTGASHSWNTGATTPTLGVSTAGLYWAENTLNGCTHRDSINVTTKSAPLLDLGADTSICNYDQIVLDAYYPGASYLWNNGDDSSAIIVAAAGKYSVVSTLSGCPAMDTIIISAKKMPVVNAGIDMVIQQNSFAQLNATPHSNNASYLWSPAATLNNANIHNPVATPTAPVTEYTVHIVSVDGCIDEDKVTVRVVYPIKIPNAFSPNGDGVNDKWVITNIELYPKSRVSIFNRYGQQIYSEGGFKGPWDGTYKGNPLEPATYYYVIDIGDGQRYTGYLVLLR